LLGMSALQRQPSSIKRVVATVHTMTTATQAWVLLTIVLIFGFVVAHIARSRFRTLLSEVSEYRERISIIQLESSSSQGRLLAAEVAENAANERLEEIRLKHSQDREDAVARIALLEGSETELSRMVAVLQTDLESMRMEAKNQKGRANSANVSKGQLLEKWAPFVDHPQIEEHWRPEDWTFMGNPIDYLVFDWHRDNETNMGEGVIVFAEIKSAGSTLSTKQRRIRDLVKAGRVEWREVRLE